MPLPSTLGPSPCQTGECLDRVAAYVVGFRQPFARSCLHELLKTVLEAGTGVVHFIESSSLLIQFRQPWLDVLEGPAQCLQVWPCQFRGSVEAQICQDRTHIKSVEGQDWIAAALGLYGGVATRCWCGSDVNLCIQGLQCFPQGGNGTQINKAVWIDVVLFEMGSQGMDE